MRTIKYPLLYYQLGPEAVIGFLVGTEHQVVEKDLRNLRSNLTDFLMRLYKKHDDYWLMDIIEPKLKIHEVKIRPVYRENHGTFPVSDVLKVPVAVVYGETDQGYYECYLPYFDVSFFYYDPRQLRSLLNYFATETLSRQSPEQLNRMMMMPTPQLDIVTLRVNEDRIFSKKGPQYERSYKILNKLCVQYPFSKAQKKSISASPEAAWELEDKTALLMDKIVNNRANVLLVGKHGVGKSAIIKQAIRRITSLSKKTNNKRTFWQIMPQRITASSKYLGEWQQKVESLIDELRSANGVLWVVDLIRMLKTGGEGPEDSLAAFITNFLRQGRLQIIGEVSPEELESMKRLLPGFVENFQILKIEELPENRLSNILDKFAEYSSKTQKVKLHKDAIDTAYRLLKRYYPYESFPGKAIKFLGICISGAKLKNETEVNKSDVIDNFIRQTGLPSIFLRDDELLDKNELQEYFQSKIIGQNGAIEKLVGVVKIFKAGLNNPGKPINTLLFAGPTGVGKTASAIALADYFFGKGQKLKPLIRIDMSEFQHPDQISRFIGLGKEPGKLVKEIRERPFSVLLLDEVEKAHKSIFDALLTVMDEGILVDAFGRITNFKNTIIIMTTNLGASNRKSIGFTNSTDIEAEYLSAISKFFRPEFINRIDSVAFFYPLTEKEIEQIAVKELNELKLREGFVKRKLVLDFSMNVVKQLAKTGFDIKYGARPLQRALEKEIVSPLANWLLEHPDIFNEKIEVDFKKKLIVNIV